MCGLAPAYSTKISTLPPHVSHTSGQITHHIGADIDAERDTLMDDLKSAGWLTALYDVTGVGPTVNGRNGGGDRYFTDGELTVGVLGTGGVRRDGPGDHAAEPDTGDAR